MTTTGLPTDGFDFTDPDLMWDGVPHEQFTAVRAASPIHWIEQPPTSRSGMAPEAGTGYWAITRHADVSRISKDSKNFSSAENGAIIRFHDEMPRDMVEMQRVMLLNQDPPEHSATRQIISRGFTPRAIGALDGIMRERAAKIVADAVAKGEVEFVEEVASELPLQAIADLLGVPQEDRKKLFDWSNLMLSYDDPDYDGDPESASIEILSYFMAMAEERKADPRDDLVTKLITAQIDGHGALNADE